MSILQNQGNRVRQMLLGICVWLMMLLAVWPTGTEAQTTTRVNVATGGGQANGESDELSISADGRFVAFESGASNLVPGDTNGVTDIFVHDRQTGSTTRISVATGGVQGNGPSNEETALSSDGRLVVFHSEATNLVPGDTNGITDIFVHDRQTGVTTRVSVATGGGQALWNGIPNIGTSENATISADGRFVAFDSFANNLVPGDTNGQYDVFVHDRQTGVTTRVSVATGGGQGNDGSGHSQLSANGRFVAFDSEASNLVTGDTNGFEDIFVHDRQTDITTRVSVTTGGGQANGETGNPALSADGRYVAFSSEATNLVPGDSNGVPDVFVHDRQMGVTTRVSVATGGGQAFGGGIDGSGNPQLSADGRFVAFASEASNLVPGDTNGDEDVFIHDRQTGATTRVSVATGGGQGNGDSSDGWLSQDGRFVSFGSDATNLVPGDTNGVEDIFVHQLDAGANSCPLSPGHADYCSTAGCGPCTSGQGDCDSSADCAAGLTCGTDNGASFGLPSNFDVCVGPSPNSCALSPGHADYCSTAGCGPCTSGQGDCDSSADCAAGLTCGTDNGAAFGLPSDFDVCVGASSSCALSPGHADFCSTAGCGPCTSGQGDCDSSADCAAGLTCGTDNGAAFGLPSDYDVCVGASSSCALSPGHADFCSTAGCGPCTNGQGDCDASSECAAGLTCGTDNGAAFGLPSDYDVCVGAPSNCPLSPGHADYCSTAGCGPCTSGQGDCDASSECASGLVCGTDNGASFGLPPNFDVCVDASTSCSLSLGDGAFCSTPGCGPCTFGQGDCDASSECASGLVCGTDNGPSFGLPSNFDVCVDASTSCSLSPGHGAFCSTAGCGPCTPGQGDCDASAECASGLVCGTDNGASFGLPSNFDVCVGAPSSTQILGIYNLTGDLTNTGCSRSADNGTFPILSTINIHTQAGATFGGTITFTALFEVFSGTVNGTIASNGSVTGTFFIEQPGGNQSQGTVNGSLSGNILSLSFSGMDIQDTCSYTGSIIGAKR